MQEQLPIDEGAVKHEFVAVHASLPAEQTVMVERETGRILGFGSVAVEGLKNVSKILMTPQTQASVLSHS